MKRSNSAGFIFLALFGGIFAAVGIIAGVTLLPKALASGKMEEMVIAIIFPVVFTGAGLSIIGLGLHSKRKTNQTEQLKERHPNEPWMWKREWAERRIPGGGKFIVIFSWGFALFWNAIGTPPILFNLPSDFSSVKPEFFAMAIFPFIGFCLLGWALYNTIAWRKFGIAYFEPQPLPGVIGGACKGLIHTSFKIEPEGDITLRLHCVNRITTSSGSDGSSTRESILWESKKSLSRNQLRMGPHGSAIPVEFTVPMKCQQTNEDNHRNTIVWRLMVETALPGVDFSKIFEIPVFVTDKSSSDVEAEEEGVEEIRGIIADASMPSSILPKSKVRVKHGSGGILQLWFGPARNKGAAVSVTIFTIIWTGIVILLNHSDAPLLFPIVFGFFDLLLLFGLTSLWFGTSKVEIRPGEITVKRGFLGTGKLRLFSKEEVSKIEETIEMQSGNKVYYGIALHLTNGKKRKLGGGIPDKGEVIALIQAMEQALEGRSALGSSMR